MKTCPVCATELLVAARQGVEIDHCPLCRGVWLDRGELDKILDRAAGHGGDRDFDDDSDWGDDRRPAPGYSGDHRPRKKEGFFGRLFDFD